MTGEILALVSAVAWAMSGVLQKMLPPKVGPVFIVATRSSVSFCVAIFLLSITGISDFINNITIVAVVYLIGSGLTGLVGQLAFVKSLLIGHISQVFPSTNGLYITFSILGTILVTKQVVTLGTVAGGFLILSGVSLLSTSQVTDVISPTEKRSRLPTLGLSVITGIAWAISVLLQNEVVAETGPILATAIRASLMAMICLAILGVDSNRRVSNIGVNPYLILLASGLLNSISAISFVAALDWSAPATVVILNSTAPLFAVPMALLFFNEQFTAKTAIGALSVFVGVAATVL